MIGRKFPSKPVGLRDKKTNVSVYASTAARWNVARGPMQMTHDSFMLFLLDMYDRSKGGIVPEQKKKEKKTISGGGYKEHTTTSVADPMKAVRNLCWTESNGTRENLNGKTARKRPHEQQVLHLPCTSLDMPPPLAVIGSNIRYLLHTRQPCTWEPEEVFSHFHQNVVLKYTATMRTIKEEHNAYVVVQDKVIQDNSAVIIRTVHDIINEMVDMVEIVIDMEEDENENSDNDIDDDDDWGPNRKRKGEGSDDGISEDEDDVDSEEWASDQDDDGYEPDIFKGPVSCNTCGKSFKGPHWLKQHKRSCVKGPINCGVCGRTFEDRRQLQQHNRVHKQKTYNCQYCDKSFSFENHLVRHVRTHTNDRPFKCDYCEKRFAQKIQLKCHLRVHTNEKPYECKKCDAAFAHNVSLVNHTRKHHSK